MFRWRGGWVVVLDLVSARWLCGHLLVFYVSYEIELINLTIRPNVAVEAPHVCFVCLALPPWQMPISDAHRKAIHLL